jgi:hypothetical protein
MPSVPVQLLTDDHVHYAIPRMPLNGPVAARREVAHDVAVYILESVAWSFLGSRNLVIIDPSNLMSSQPGIS